MAYFLFARQETDLTTEGGERMGTSVLQKILFSHGTECTDYTFFEILCHETLLNFQQAEGGACQKRVMHKHFSFHLSVSRRAA